MSPTRSFEALTSHKFASSISSSSTCSVTEVAATTIPGNHLIKHREIDCEDKITDTDFLKEKGATQKSNSSEIQS